MARKQRQETDTAHWHAQPDDAIRLAALRWFALRIESLAIEIYATDQTRYAAMERLFRQTLKRMTRVRRSAQANLETDCPDGYVLCKDGICAPMCDGIISTEE